jgi:hypothetical protein
MIRSLKFKWAFVLLPLLLLWPLVTYRHPVQHPPFRIRIIDAQSQRGLPNVRLIADNRITCYTNGDGVVRWGEQDLMDRDIHFSIRREGYWFPNGETTLRVSHGVSVELAVQPSTQF